MHAHRTLQVVAHGAATQRLLSGIDSVPLTQCSHARQPPLQVVATAQALLANGGVMAPVGMHIAAMAAK